MPHLKGKIDSAIAETLLEIDRIDRSSVEEAVRLLARLRERVVLLVAETGPLDQAVVEAVRTRVAGIVQEFEERLKTLMSENQGRMFTRGIKLVDRAVDAADLTRAVPYIDNAILEQSMAFTAQLITNLTSDIRGKIDSEIQLGVLGQKPASEIIKAIGTNLEDPSVFGTIRRRSEIIVRTEVNRVQAMATQERMEQLKQQVPDLKKQWNHSHLGQPPRANHLALDGVTVPVGGKFELKSKDGSETYLIDGPYDPVLPVGETINCRCITTTVVGRFEVVQK